MTPVSAASAWRPARGKSPVHCPCGSRHALLCLIVIAGWTLAATLPDAAAQPRPEEVTDGGVWLARVQAAAQHINYAGTFIYQQGSQVQSSRITHLADASGEHEKLEVLDGQPREFIRHNEDVRCYVPDSKVILSEKRAKSDNFPAVLTAVPIEIDQHYRFARAGMERVAGRSAEVARLDARDKQRYGYKLWSDRETGLLLKAQTIGEQGDVIEQVAFTDIVVGGTIDRARLRPSAPSTEGWRVEKSEMVPADLSGAGWSVAAPIPGFRKIMEVKRSFGGRRDVGQIVYSDGLAAISLFIEPADPKGMAEGDARKGPINVVSKRHGDHWLTVVGEAPAASIRQVANSVEYKPPK